MVKSIKPNNFKYIQKPNNALVRIFTCIAMNHYKLNTQIAELNKRLRILEKENIILRKKQKQQDELLEDIATDVLKMKKLI